MDLNSPAEVTLSARMSVEAPSAAIVALEDEPKAFAEQETLFEVRGAERH